MKYGRKALSMPMEIIIAVVVLVVIALAVIMFTTGGITKTGGSAAETGTVATSGMNCEAQARAWCANNPTRDVCRGASATSTECNRCDTDRSCGRTCRPVTATTCPSGTIRCADPLNPQCTADVAPQICCV